MSRVKLNWYEKKYKTVKRKYVSKKTGEVKIYEYKYFNGTSRRGPIFVTKKGKINYKNVNKYKEAVKNSDLDPAEKLSLIREFEAEVQARSKRNARVKDGRQLTAVGWSGMQEKNDRKRMFINAGYEIEEVAEMYDLSEEELLNENNWNGDEFTASDGTRYIYKHNYTEAIFQRIKNK